MVRDSYPCSALPPYPRRIFSYPRRTASPLAEATMPLPKWVIAPANHARPQSNSPACFESVWCKLFHWHTLPRMSAFRIFWRVYWFICLGAKCLASWQTIFAEKHTQNHFSIFIGEKKTLLEGAYEVYFRWLFLLFLPVLCMFREEWLPRVQTFCTLQIGRNGRNPTASKPLHSQERKSDKFAVLYSNNNRYEWD